MPTKDELTADINSMAIEITEALTKLTNDEAVDLKNIEPRVRVAMDAVGDLAPDDAIEIRPVLVSMLEKMEEFSLVLQSKIDEIEAEVANASSEDTDDND
ncbi:hypothetical protein N9452_00130 [Alphaproteobacteria bacterium]|jgi:hypothetical protein|nr:hypothetical protein [Alphaproteobacteria bacterium]